MATGTSTNSEAPCARHPLRVAVVGIQGVPAAYGGFETLVENLLGPHCPESIRYTVFCSAPETPPGPDGTRPSHYKGARLRYLPLGSHGVQSIAYDVLSLARCLRGYDATLVLGTSGCIALPVFRLLTRRRRLIVNIDGLEHRRAKWGRAARTWLRLSEALAVKCADVTVADNDGIADYVRSRYGVEPAVIAYGGDQAVRDVEPAVQAAVLSRYGVERGGYAITVCRIEPENNPDMLLEAFGAPDSPLPLLFIGNWERSDYGRQMRRRHASNPRLKLCDPEYDLDVLYTLRSNAALYVHGHSAGGSNPSLIEAMMTGVPVAVYDVVYNRATTGGLAVTFADAASLRALARHIPPNGEALRGMALERYTWQAIADSYTSLLAP